MCWTLQPNVLQVLLFSYSTQMLDILEAMIVRKGYIYLRPCPYPNPAPPPYPCPQS